MFYLVKVESKVVSVQILFEELGLQSLFEDGEVFCCPDLYPGACCTTKEQEQGLVLTHVCEDV